MSYFTKALLMLCQKKKKLTYKAKSFSGHTISLEIPAKIGHKAHSA